MSIKLTDPTHFVIVQERHGMSGVSYAAIKGLSFETREAAQAHIVKTVREGFRRRYTVEERKVQADTSHLRMTCQCCARPILANTGRIAKHGYQRPGHGWQTASCYGADELPFEVSRDCLGSLINLLGQRRASHIEHRYKVANDKAPVSYSYTDRNTAKRNTVTVTFTRETFEAVKAEHKRGFGGGYVRSETFEAYRDHHLQRIDRETEALRLDIEACKKRYDAWKQTHAWVDGAWKVL
jgi:hypothetical protein